MFASPGTERYYFFSGPIWCEIIRFLGPDSVRSKVSYFSLVLVRCEIVRTFFGLSPVWSVIRNFLSVQVRSDSAMKTLN